MVSFFILSGKRSRNELRGLLLPKQQIVGMIVLYNKYFLFHFHYYTFERIKWHCRLRRLL